jgi:hypothetical protein
LKNIINGKPDEQWVIEGMKAAQPNAANGQPSGRTEPAADF